MLVINKLMIKILNWYFPEMKLKKELECELKAANEEIEELRRLLYNQPDIIPDKPDQIIKIRSQEGWKLMDELPKYSVPECIVTDGEIVQCVQYDHNTKSFLKCFGSQSMYVRNPIAWMPLPLPPVTTDGYLQNNQRFSSHMAQTYNR